MSSNKGSGVPSRGYRSGDSSAARYHEGAAHGAGGECGRGPALWGDTASWLGACGRPPRRRDLSLTQSPQPFAQACRLRLTALLGQTVWLTLSSIESGRAPGPPTPAPAQGLAVPVRDREVSLSRASSHLGQEEPTSASRSCRPSDYPIWVRTRSLIFSRLHFSVSR